MPAPINIYASQITPKQKKDLLGIYQDYLYFERGLELALQINSTTGLAGILMKQMNWLENMNLRWNVNFATPTECENYLKIVNGDTTAPKQYAYMSLYHTKKEQDSTYKKISDFPHDYTYTTIDLTLPCPIERYAITFPSDQKFKDANIIIDGLFKITYNHKFKDQGETPLIDILSEYTTQKEFKVLLGLLEYYHHNMYELERNHAKDFSHYVTDVMMKMMASAAVSGFENKVLDLLGSYADKSQEILRSIFSNASTKDLWKIAEKNGLIASAENMQHFLNIRHLLRHQWDILEGNNKLILANRHIEEKLHEEYMASYNLIFDKTIAERIKTYQKITQQLQPLLMILYPEFIARETGESNSKFVKRIKQWQQQNPGKTPLITGNYLLKDEKHTSLVNNLKKVAPSAKVLDDMQADALEKYNYMEESYFNRTSFLKIYNQLESNILTFCKNHGIPTTPESVWQYLKENILTEEEYRKWIEYRQLRNKLSHCHLNDELKAELGTALKVFDKDAISLLDKIGEYQLSQTTPAKAPIAATNRNKNKPHKPNTPTKKYSVSLLYGEKEVLECKFKNGTIIDLKRKKIIFPDNTRLYFDAENFNIFRFENGSKLFTDKTFIVTKFLERGRHTPISRNENCIVAPKHKIRTDKNTRIVEDCIIKDNQRLITSFNYTNQGAFITLEDGTKIKDLSNELIISHHNIELKYENRYAFKQSYLEGEPPPPSPMPFKPPFSR